MDHYADQLCLFNYLRRDLRVRLLDAVANEVENHVQHLDIILTPACDKVLEKAVKLLKNATMLLVESLRQID